MPEEPPTEEEFRGHIGDTVYESTPWWPAQPLPPEDAPDVVCIVLDDTGFAHLGCYGSTIDTPNIDSLAAGGLQFTGFHTTAVCSATRACLMTGRNHHSVGMAKISNMDTGYPNMRGAIPRGVATLPEILRDRGYTTLATGKWHLAPMAECTSAGPFHNWPLQRGFDRYYGFLQGETDQFYPELTCGNEFIDPPSTPEQGYHVSQDIVDQAMRYVRDSVSLVPERPFFLYLAFGATHSPHQAPRKYLDKYRGRFDAGWDEIRQQWYQRQLELGVIPRGTGLAPRNPGVKPWAELSGNERQFAARLQEAFAAMLDHTDDQIGRLLAFLKQIGRFENTLLVFLSDNGASQEGLSTGLLDEFRYFNGMPEDVDRSVRHLDDIGGPRSHSNIPWGWAQAGNTPLKWYKQNTHGGGVRDPFIVHWPAGLGQGGQLRRQFCHAIDLAPTILDLAGIEAPDSYRGIRQTPMHGASLAQCLRDEAAAPAREAQYFEMFGHRGLWSKGWKVVTHHRRGAGFEDDDWELYKLSEDFSECRNLAAEQPRRVKEMVAHWWREARQHGVLPLDDRGAKDLFRAAVRPGLPGGRRRFVYFPPVSHIVSDGCPQLSRGGTITVEARHPAEGAGILVARGDINSGFVLYVKNKCVHFDYNCFHEHTLVSTDPVLEAGDITVEVQIERGSQREGYVRLAVNGDLSASGVIRPRLVPMISSRGMDLGRSTAPVCDAYQPPFAYPGTIHSVTFDIPASRDPNASSAETTTRARAAMGRQ